MLYRERQSADGGECGGHVWAPADERPYRGKRERGPECPLKARPPALEGEHLVLLLLRQLLDPGGEAVGGLLDLVVGAALLVLGELLLLGERLELVVGLAAHVAHRHARVLRELAHR